MTTECDRRLTLSHSSSPDALATELAAVGYFVDRGLATSAFLSLRLRMPMFLEGDAGVGKTALAGALAQVLNARLIRLQCYEGIDATQALYDWNFPKQILHLRAAEAAHRDAEAEALEAELYSREFLVARPLLQALETTPAVLLVDEVDRADDEFEAFLLEVLSEYSVSIPELGTIRADVPPVVVLTSNRTREVHDALKRRCFYHWVGHPDVAREVEILRARLPGVGERLAAQVAAAVQRMREMMLLKPPGVAESLAWARALGALEADALDEDAVHATLGCALKFREDQDRVVAAGIGSLVGPAGGDGRA